MHMYDKLHWIYTVQDLSPILMNWIPKQGGYFCISHKNKPAVSMDCYINQIYQNCEGAILFFHP